MSASTEARTEGHGGYVWAAREPGDGIGLGISGTGYKTPKLGRPFISEFRSLSPKYPNQIRSVDRKRLVKHVGAVDAATMRRIDEALLVSLGLIDF